MLVSILHTNTDEEYTGVADHETVPPVILSWGNGATGGLGFCPQSHHPYIFQSNVLLHC